MKSLVTLWMKEVGASLEVAGGDIIGIYVVCLSEIFCLNLISCVYCCDLLSN